MIEREISTLRHRRTRPPLLLAALVVSALGANGAFGSPAPWATGESKPEDLRISLVTFGVGDEVISWWGHTALVVEDLRLQHGRLYNYGLFAFDSKMLARYAMGRLEFWVGDEGIGPALRFYARQDRDVRIQVLNLDLEKRGELAKALAENVLPENRAYLYHHYFDNCSTRPRDMVDRALGGALRKNAQASGRMTLREHTRRHTAVAPPMGVLLDFLMNDEIDRRITVWDEAFLPVELERLLDNTRYVTSTGQTVPLVESKRDFHKSTRPPTPAEPPSHAGPLLAIGFAFGLCALGLGFGIRRRQRWAQALLGVQSALAGLVLGIPGLALFIMALATEHTVTWRNENLLLANPITLACLPLGVSFALGRRWGARWIRVAWTVLAGSGLLLIAMKIFPSFDQNNWNIIGLLLPMSLGFAGGLWLARGARQV